MPLRTHSNFARSAVFLEGEPPRLPPAQGYKDSPLRAELPAVMIIIRPAAVRLQVTLSPCSSGGGLCVGSIWCVCLKQPMLRYAASGEEACRSRWKCIATTNRKKCDDASDPIKNQRVTMLWS